MATSTAITFTGDGPATATYVSPGTHVLQVHRANPGVSPSVPPLMT